MTTTTLQINKDYGLVIMSASAIATSYILSIPLFVSPARKKAFNKEFLQKHFGEVHKLEVGGSVPKGGYPDMGTGRYSQLLTYKDWLELNSAYRVFLNFGEHIGVIIPFTLLAGLRYPRVAAGLGFGYVLSRFLYGFGYTKRPESRLAGFLGIGVITIALGVLSAVTGYKIFNK